MKVVDLKKELSTRGLLQSGLKQDLVNRLTADDEQKTAPDIAPEIETDAPPQELRPQNGDASILNDGGAEVEEERAKATGLDASADILEGSTLIETSEEEKRGIEQAQNVLPVDADDFTNGKIAPTNGDAMDVESTPQPAQGENDETASKATVEMPIEELVSDSQKRKRRSLTPDIPSDEAVKKRMRVSQSPDVGDDYKLGKEEVKTTKDDAEWVEEHNGVDSSEVNAEAMEVGAPMEGVENGPMIVDVAKEEVVIEPLNTSTANEEERQVDETELNNYPEGNLQNTGPDGITSNVAAEAESPPHLKAKDGRFKDLFPASKMDQTVGDDAMEGVEVDRTISPAIHPATTALYIRDFMRPLNSNTLKEYLTFLATPPSSETDPSIIQDFYLDTIRTHAYVSFSNISAASRVRSAIHGTVWPEETNRKPLWADFIPAEKVQDWIEEEKSCAGNGRTGGKKFEVAYEEDYHGKFIAVLRESDPRNVPARQNSMAGMGIASAPRGGMTGVPLGPRSSIPHDVNPYDNRNLDMPRRPSHFPPTVSLRLENGFKSTTASPLLYYQPVSKELVKKRLDNMDRITRSDYRRDEQASEIHRYTFEDGDKIVDRGPEVFEGIRPVRGPPSRYRGGGGGDNSRYRDRREGRGRDRDRYTGGGGGGSRYGGGGGQNYRPIDDGYRGSGTRRW